MLEQKFVASQKNIILRENVTIVIPTYNEEKAIGKVIDELKEEGFKKILIVDGYSTDRTVEVAKKRGVDVIFQHGKGKAGAIKTAIEKVETPYMLVLDGDYTYPASEIDKLLNHVDSYDYIIGARVNGRENIPKLNRLGNWILTKAFNVLTNANFTDVCSGMYLLKTEKARQLEINSSGFEVEAEIAAQMTNERCTEVPIKYRKRIGKQKLSSLRHGISIMRTIIRLSYMYNPTLLFSAVAASSIIPAIIILLWVTYENIIRGIWHSGWALFGVMLLLLATQALTVATISVLLRRVEFRLREKIDSFFDKK